MRKSTIIFIVTIVLIAVVSILIPVLINYQDAGASNVENDGGSTQRHEIDKTLESAIDLLPAKYMNRIARVVKDTLDMYFREHFDVAGDLIAVDDKPYFIITDNKFFSNFYLEPGNRYARTEYSIKGVLCFEESEKLVAFAKASEILRHYQLGEESISLKDVKASFKEVACYTDVDIKLLLDIAIKNTEYEDVRDTCYAKLKYNYDEMFVGLKNVTLQDEGHIRIYNDDKTTGFNVLYLELLKLYETELRKQVLKN